MADRRASVRKHDRANAKAHTVTKVGPHVRSTCQSLKNPNHMPKRMSKLIAEICMLCQNIYHNLCQNKCQNIVLVHVSRAFVRTISQYMCTCVVICVRFGVSCFWGKRSLCTCSPVAKVENMHSRGKKRPSKSISGLSWGGKWLPFLEGPSNCKMM